MKMWILFAIGAVIAWGAYAPVVHEGQKHLGNSALRAFLVVGIAYFATAVLAPLGILGSSAEPWEFGSRGVTFSAAAGVLSALGALCLILALNAGGTPLVVAPLVFAGAPVVNTLVSMAWQRPKAPPEPLFYVGLMLTAVGIFILLRYRPT